jgi:hypothetical protein
LADTHQEWVEDIQPSTIESLGEIEKLVSARSSWAQTAWITFLTQKRDREEAIFSARATISRTVQLSPSVRALQPKITKGNLSLISAEPMEYSESYFDPLAGFGCWLEQVSGCPVKVYQYSWLEQTHDYHRTGTVFE